MTKPKKGFKAMDKDFKCNGYQFEVGKTHKHDGPIQPCHSGFHFCELPLDIFDYKDLIGSRFAAVESNGEFKDDGNKTVAAELHIEKEISVMDLIKSHIDIVFSFCFEKGGIKILKNTKKASGDKFAKLAASGYGSQLAASGYGSQLAASGDGSQLAASGDGSQLAASGYGSKLAASGDGSQLAASGYGSKLAASGYGSKLAASGDGSQLAASGDGSQLAASGYGSQLAASGYGSKLAASGDGSKLAASGDGSKLAASGLNSVVAGIGIHNTAKAKDGSWIVLAEWVVQGDRYVPVNVKVAKVGQDGIKADVEYKLQGGVFVEAA